MNPRPRDVTTFCTQKFSRTAELQLRFLQTLDATLLTKAHALFMMTESNETGRKLVGLMDFH